MSVVAHRLVATCLVAVAALVGGCEDRRAPLVAVPTVDMSAYEPAVRKSIDDARARVDALAASKASDAERAEAYGDLAMRYQVHDLAAPAEAAYRDARILAPKDKRWPYLLGHLYNDTARQADAIATFESVLALDPGDALTLSSLGSIALQHGDLDRARDAYQRLLGIPAARVVALAGLGRVALAQHDYPTAVQRLEECLAAAPQAGKVRAPLAAAYRAQGRMDKVDEVLKGRTPDDVEPSLPDPLADLLDSRIASSRGLMRRGQRFGNAGRFDLAAEAFGAATTADPKNAEAFADLGISLANLNQLEAATRALEQSLRLDASGATAHATLAVVLDRRGDDAGAIAHYRAALAGNPADGQSQVYLADALMRGGDAAGAAALYEAALAATPSGRVRFSLALANVRAKRFGRARELLEQALAETPDSVTLKNALARVLATAPDRMVRDGPRALQLATRLFEATRTPEIGQTYAMAMAASGDFEHAIKLQEETIIAYQRMGVAGEEAFLQANLASYRAGRTAAEPWPPDDPLFKPRSPAVRRG